MIRPLTVVSTQHGRSVIRLSFYAQQLCFARLSHGLGVCVCVRPSHSAALSKQNHKIFTVGYHNDSSFLRQNFVPLGKGVPLERGREIEVPPVKCAYFTAIGSCSVKTLADRHAAYHNKH